MFGTTNRFGASSSSAFGSSMTAFGCSSSSFGGSFVFGQKPAYGFGSTPTQSSPFGSTTQLSQPAFGSGIFGSSTPFGSTQSGFGSSTPAFGTTSTPAFGATSTPAFGATSAPAFGSTSTPTFGSTGSPAFGNTGTAFGVSNAPAFGKGGTFGASRRPAFGTSSTPAFGAYSSAFGGSSTPAFGASSTPFSFRSSPAFGQSTPAFGTQSSAPAFGSTSFGQSPFGGQHGGSRVAPYTPTTEADSGSGTQPAAKLESISAMPVYRDKSHEELRWEDYQLGDKGTQSSAPAFGSTSFGQSPFGDQRGGSRVAPYTPTTEADSGSGTQSAAKLETISAMPVYKDKSHEELRWEDYQLGGGPQPAAQPSGGIGFGVSTAPTSPLVSSTFGQISANPFSSTSTNLLSLKPPSFNSTSFTTLTATSNPFKSTSSSLFGPTLSTTSIFTSSATPTFGTGSSLFSLSVTPSFPILPSIFGTAAAPTTTSAFATGGPQPAAQPSGGIGFGVSTAPTSLLISSSTFGQISANPFSSTSTNLLSLKPPSFNSTSFTTLTATSNPFKSTSSSLSGPTLSTTSIFTSSATPIFGTGSSLFSLSVTPSFPISPSIFGTGAAPATTSAFATGLNFSSSQTTPLFNSTPAIGQTSNVFGQVTSTFGQSTSNFGQTSIFYTASTGFSGNMFSSSLSMAPSNNPAAFGPTTPSFASPFKPAQTSGAFSFTNFGGASGIFGQSNIGLPTKMQRLICEGRKNDRRRKKIGRRLMANAPFH